MAYAKGQILTVKTSGSNLNMRNAANSSGALVTSVPNGSSVTATTGALVTGAGSTKGWLQVTYSGKTGYVSSDYLVAATTAATTTTPTTTPKATAAPTPTTAAATPKVVVTPTATTAAATPAPSAVVATAVSPSATIAPDATPMVTEADSKSKMRKMLIIGGVAVAAVVAFFAYRKLKI